MNFQYSFTINTDASFDPNTGAASFAFWIKSTHFVMKGARLINEHVTNSSVAELLGVEAALHYLHDLVAEQQFLSDQLKTNGIKVYFNTDSMFVLDVMNGRIKSKRNAAVIERFRPLLEDYNCEFRHVKAHTRKDTARHWVNDWCDKEAKMLMKKRRKEILDGQIRKAV